MFYIYAVHKNKDDGAIEQLRYSDRFGEMQIKSCSKTSMIRYINRHPDTVMTMCVLCGRWVTGEYVHVVDNEYLRTDANDIKADNLANLKEY